MLIYRSLTTWSVRSWPECLRLILILFWTFAWACSHTRSIQFPTWSPDHHFIPFLYYSFLFIIFSLNWDSLLIRCSRSIRNSFTFLDHTGTSRCNNWSSSLIILTSVTYLIVISGAMRCSLMESCICIISWTLFADLLFVFNHLLTWMTLWWLECFNSRLLKRRCYQ